MKSAFDGAEYSPSENAWVNIELELERAEGKKMRRRIFYYKMLAAASVTFALAVAGAGLFYLNNEQSIVANQPTQIRDSSTGQELAVNQTQVSDDSASPITTRPGNEIPGSIAVEQNNVVEEQSGGIAEGNSRQPGIAENNALAERKAGMAGDRVEKGRESTTTTSDALSRLENTSTPPPPPPPPPPPENRNNDKDDKFKSGGDEGLKNELLNDELPNDELPTDRYDNHIALTSPEEGADNNLAKADAHTDTSTKDGEVIADADPATEADPVQLMFQKLQDREREIAERANKRTGKEESNHEELWTSLGFAAGGYNGSGSHLAMSPANAIAMNSTLDNQAKASGSSYSVNVSFGRRLTERLVIQGGLSYLNNNTNYVSNQVVLDRNN